ncbi:hypothetical protein [Nocardia brasiliensis]|uniref:hypothetical protein n=1 Tax=Nocardia brasiliensis TaxID=37326 RepID=UPI0024571341|nr:hypothetical protein [Nocardia brasiliensis]
MLLAATCAVTPGVAHATPDPQMPWGGATPATGVNYRASATSTSAIIETDSGSLTTDADTFTIRAANGTVLAGIPLSMRIDDFVYPIAVTIEDRIATLTPQVDTAHARYQPVHLPFQEEAPWKSRYEREQAAWARAQGMILAGSASGVALGTAGGAVIGCLAGALVGAAVTGILLALFGAGPLAGCIAGIAIGVGVGVAVGALFISVPAVVAAVIEYFTTINSPLPLK